MKQRMPGTSSEAFTLIELLVVIMIVMILFVLAAPRLFEDRRPAKIVLCMTHLRQVGLGFHLWAADHQDRFPWQIETSAGGTMELSNDTWSHFRTLALSNYLRDPKVLL